jgi:hypothetical protein
MVALLLAAAAVAVALWWIGYRSQREPRLRAESRVAELEAAKAGLQQKLRLHALKDELRELLHAVEQSNYGLARERSSEVFDRVRTESQRAATSELRQPLERILGVRDRVTAGLAQGDPSVREPLRESIDALRQQLGRPALYSSAQAQHREAGVAATAASR